jgi:hypothetical protein
MERRREEKEEQMEEYEAEQERKRALRIWQKNKNIILLELGGGHIFNLSYLYHPVNSDSYFGAGFAYTYTKYEFLNYEYPFSLFNFFLAGMLNIMEQYTFNFYIRLKLGYETISTKNYFAGATLFSPDFLLSYKNIFATLSFPLYFFREKVLFLYQIGVGWQFRF